MKLAATEPMVRVRQLDDNTIAESVTGFAVIVLVLCFLTQGVPHSSQICSEILVIVFLIWLAYRTTQPPLPTTCITLALEHHETEDVIQNKMRAAVAQDLAHAQRDSELTISKKLLRIDWFQFEKVIELIYLRCGYSVRRLGNAKMNGSVDLIVESPTEQFIVQCKPCRKSKIGVGNIRELLETLAANKVSRGVLFTMAGYSEGARLAANEHGIQISNESELINILEQSELACSDELSFLLCDETKLCPQCENQMVLRIAHLSGNQLWECSNFPSCKFTQIRES